MKTEDIVNQIKSIVENEALKNMLSMGALEALTEVNKNLLMFDYIRQNPGEVYFPK